MSHLGQIGVIERGSGALVVCDIAKLSQMVQQVRG
jgi:hypothetical protein